MLLPSFPPSRLTDYVGRAIDAIITQKVKVLWKEKDEKEEVVILD